MPKRIAFVEAEIDRRLTAAVAPDSPNRVTADEVRKWAREYLRDHSPSDDLTLAHRNVWMRDVRFEDGLFVAMIFRRECVEFLCGVADSFAFRRFCHDYDGDDGGIFDALSQRFHVPEPPLRIERRAAALWLGRGWKP